MSQPGPVLAHLLEGREALVQEIGRLAGAVDELDAVIAQLGGAELSDSLPKPLTAPVTSAGGRSVSGAEAAKADQRRTGAGNGRARAGAASAAGGGQTSRPARKTTSGTARTTAASKAMKSAAKPAASTASRGATARAGSAARQDSSTTAAGGAKSIRVHVLEMLAAENRDFGLAEIIERIHGYGIAAHDDAVRSITIKLMKDGRVERVGRGQYRLARRGSARAGGRTPAAGDAEPATAAPRVQTAGSESPTAPTAPTAGTNTTAEPARVAQETPQQAPGAPLPSTPHHASDAQTAGTRGSATPAAASFPPPLNLGQPWESRS